MSCFCNLCLIGELSSVKYSTTIAIMKIQSFRYTILCSLLLLLSGTLQRSDAQSSSNPLPDYHFNVSLPPIAEQGDQLSLPQLSIYDRENLYLQVRDSSQDWYDINAVYNDEISKEIAISQTFGQQISRKENESRHTPGHETTSPLLDAGKRIIPEENKALLDESLVRIPRLR